MLKPLKLWTLYASFKSQLVACWLVAETQTQQGDGQLLIKVQRHAVYTLVHVSSSWNSKFFFLCQGHTDVQI